jgi:Tfp pilus assembly protein PilF
VLIGRHLTPDPNRWSEALQMLVGLDSELDRVTDPLSVLDLYRLRAGLYYLQNDYQKSADEYLKGLELSPDDPEFNNNLAFTLATHLNRANDAVQYAERAAARDPDNPAVLDTLGVLYTQTSQYAKADQILTRALEAAKDPLNRIAAQIHLARVKLALRDPNRARSLAADAQGLIASDPLLQQTYQSELESLMQELEKAE